MNDQRQKDEGLERTEFRVPKMDCPSEERAIRTVLEGHPTIRGLKFNLPQRHLTVWHGAGDAAFVESRLKPLGFGAEAIATTAETAAPVETSDAQESRTLWTLLAINGVMFVVEIVAGLLFQSAGLLADSLDMFADAAVYGLGLYAVGRAVKHKLRAAHFSGGLQLLLALGAFFEVVRRFIVGSEPEPSWMILVALVALAANVSCLYLVSKHKEGGAHMKASYIFSTNDVIANLGVILAGVLVAVTGSRLPDLAVGSIIATVVLVGAVRILRLR